MSINFLFKESVVRLSTYRIELGKEEKKDKITLSNSSLSS